MKVRENAASVGNNLYPGAGVATSMGMVVPDLIRLRPWLLALLLLALPVRRSVAEDRVDFTVGYYLEDHHRVDVWTSAMLWETDVTPHTIMRLQGVYDVVSGASPTGAPPAQKTKTQTKEVTTSTGTGGAQVITGYNVISGPTGTAPTYVPIFATVGAGATTTTQTEVVPYGKKYLPVQEFEDERLSLNWELEHQLGGWIFTGGAAYSEEADYKSMAGTVKVGREFNHKATLLSLGASLGHDWVLHTEEDESRWEDKDIVEGQLGLVHAINPKTLLTLTGTLGSSEGYLNDQYKYASVDDDIVREQRPDSRDKRIALVMLNRAVDTLNGSAELMYRFYTDSYGVDAQTVGFTWYQKLGKRFILAPSLRYYEQSAADFYATEFTGAPKIYSSDYRLSKLATLTAGLKLIWKAHDKFTISLAYDRYSMWGRDAATSNEAYPDANVVTLGFKLWY